jgi:NAD(P)-dependent dehydrogenase (short-subunit alcohol dehydrogenase family)
MSKVSPAFDPLALNGRHFVITGAASGIGRATAVLMHKLGAKLSVVDRDVEGLDALCKELDAAELVMSHPFDLSKTAEIAALFDNIVAQGGLLHGAVHCAGTQSVVPVRSLQLDTWRDIFTLNTEAALVLAKCMASKKVYAGDHGAIVFISSIMALAGSPGSVAYSASKAALHGMARSLALEFAPKKLRVNCVAPGFVHTPMFEKTEKLWDDAQREAVEALHPLGFGQPDDVANAIAFLAGDMGRWITGSVLVVDGGYLAR